MQSFFKELFEYSHHYNQEIWKVLVDQPEANMSRSLTLYNHILNAHHIWNNRIRHTTPLFAVWEERTINGEKQVDTANFELSLQILEEIDLEKVVRYTNSQGQPFENTGRDILFHIINHSTYHRAQIATEFRRIDVAPVMSDYIFYKR
ncbi:DinB family protein [Niabella insulamsoli]|uniref:DinB family protein n=1 Tax=Niabella insulamsoli TaxID=3144874 RepID=UPI0031FDC94B